MKSLGLFSCHQFLLIDSSNRFEDRSRKLTSEIVVIVLSDKWFCFCFAALPLHCKVCISCVSWDDCAKSQEALTCESADSYCYRHSVQADFGGYNLITFAKGCATSDKCTRKAVNRCKNSQSQNQAMQVKHAKCNLECCQGDLCY